MRKCIKQLINLFRAKDNLIFVNTYEENAFLKEVCSAVQFVNEGESVFNLPKNVFVYSRTEGMYQLDISEPLNLKPDKFIKTVKNHIEALEYIKNIQNGTEQHTRDLLDYSGNTSTSINNQEDKEKVPSIFVFKDLHFFFNDKDFIRKLRDIKETYGDKKIYCPIVITAPVMEFPPELEKLFTVFDFEMLGYEEIYEMIYPLAKGIYKDKSEEEINRITKSLASACVGLTEREITRALAHSLAKNNKQELNRKDIYDEKLQIIRKSNALDFIEPQHNLSDLGGCDNFKNWICHVKEAIDSQAQAFGIPYPKGAMLVGVPGTSKTVSAEILASYLNVPLLSLDMAKVMGSLVGQSERQIANALRIAQAVAPCVLLVDEAEKGFGGFSSSSSCDAGTLSRTMGQLLTFLNKDNTGVITIMTSNNVAELPPELTRAGRLDAQWVFDLPNIEERQEIINIYLKKNNLSCDKDKMEYFIKNSENFTGAEIRNAVNEMLIACYYRQKRCGVDKFSRELSSEDIQYGLENTITVYKSSKEKIDAFRNYAKGRYLNASKIEAKNKNIPVKPNKNLFSFVPGSTSKRREK